MGYFWYFAHFCINLSHHMWLCTLVVLLCTLVPIMLPTVICILNDNSTTNVSFVFQRHVIPDYVILLSYPTFLLGEWYKYYKWGFSYYREIYNHVSFGPLLWNSAYNSDITIIEKKTVIFLDLHVYLQWTCTLEFFYPTSNNSWGSTKRL